MVIDALDPVLGADRRNERLLAGDDNSEISLEERCERHVLGRLAQTTPDAHPFRHMFIDGIFPSDVYDTIRDHMVECKYSAEAQDRDQDSRLFVNRRFNIFRSEHRVASLIRGLFSTPTVVRAIAERFYIEPSDEFLSKLIVHKEYEYFFTSANRFQNIHVDIPPKFLSFVFYIPERPVAPNDEGANSTILYDRSLKPHHRAKFRRNSVCVFAPHFYSYHGFASTIDRDVLVMFHVHQDELTSWRATRASGGDNHPYIGIRDAIERKLIAYPLIEYGNDAARIGAERRACLINAPLGRVLRGGDRY